MKDYLNIINDKYPIRRKEDEKKLFREYINNETLKYGYNVKIETLKNKHNNILIGNVDDAKVVFTAHYDTPARSIFPNLMMPRRPILTMIYQFIYAMIFVIVALFVAFIVGEIFSLMYNVIVILYVLLYFILFFFFTRTFPNKHNKNDNTSGIATIMSIIEKNSNNNDIAFILFDNEEKGLLGSKAFSSVHNNHFSNKLVINLDCVGYGNNIIFIVKDDAKELEEYRSLKNKVIGDEKYRVYFYDKKGSISNSDYKNFKCGIGVMATKIVPVIGFCTPRIHTNFDTIANCENIEFISSKLTDFINDLN